VKAAQFPGPVEPPENAPPRDGYKGDTLELVGNSFTLPGAGTFLMPINTLLWTIDYTYAGTETDPTEWSDLVFYLDATRSISVGGASGSIIQTATLKVTWDNDYLSLSSGDTVFYNTSGYRVYVTPLGLEEVGGTLFPDYPGGNPWVQPSRNVMAEFRVEAVPDSGATLALLGCALFGLGALRRKFNV
jgi:hypothetical protein